MVTTDNLVGLPIPIPDFASPEFAGVRSDLARLYLQHRVDLGLVDVPDVIGMVDDITSVLLGLTVRAF